MNVPQPPTSADRERAIAEYRRIVASRATATAAVASPSLFQKAANFASAAAQHVAAGAPMASDEEIARRHAICVGCEFFDGKACTKCGCPVRREKAYLSKLSWADQSCPVGRWGPVARIG